MTRRKLENLLWREIKRYNKHRGEVWGPNERRTSRSSIRTLLNCQIDHAIIMYRKANRERP